MLMRNLFVPALIGLLTLSAPAAAGDFFNVSGETQSIIYRGEIKAGDEIKLQNTFRNKFYYTIYLDSEGGNVDTALAMGRLIREKRKFISIPSNFKCRSACVFLLAGGVQRNVKGEVAIHRPYFSDLSADVPREEIQKAYDGLVRKSRLYLEGMNVPGALAEAMFSIPPASSHRLSSAELTRYMLNQIDPVYDEFISANEASGYRITSGEYRRRQSIVERQCDLSKLYEKFDGDVDLANREQEVCTVSIFAQLPLATARERYITYQKVFEKAEDLEDIKSCQASVYLDGAKTCPMRR